jgi:hypothetical protein
MAKTGEVMQVVIDGRKIKFINIAELENISRIG